MVLVPAVFQSFYCTYTLYKTNTYMVLVPAVFQSIYCNYALYKTSTSLRRTKDNFETVNGQLGSALCSDKYLKMEM